ncbi:MAG: hypothetical protein JW959_10715 [Pirellulales bacterium]|nr:hypothetical protein [Pirellulales bacterium]
MRRIPIPLSIALFLLATTGCQKSDRAALGKVSGTVSYRGEPVASGTVIFEVRGARTAYGKIDDGKIIEVTTYKPGDGAPLGPARIAVFVPAPEDAPSERVFQRDLYKSLIPPKYGDPAASGLTFEIAAGDNNLVLDLR